MIPNYSEMFDALCKRYTAAHPQSYAAMQEAANWMPGGNTRSVLHYDPFPLVIVSGEASHVTDLDGHKYLDCVGEFSAGLYGHNDPVIRKALQEAMEGGLTLGGPNRWEAKLAAALCARYPSVDKVRFCNSGTEANLFAIVTARAATKRNAVVVFDGAYHGGVMTFAGGGNPMNVPFEWIVLPYNDSDSLQEAMKDKGDSVAAILVEPILGAGGNIPATDRFLASLREEATRAGAILIFDEVKTSRCGPSGVQGLSGVTPDLTTFGKYLGGGLPLGAFGGRADIMDRFDPRQPHPFKHAGTFNNNVMSMAAGFAGLTQVYTAERAHAFHRDSEAFKHGLIEQLQQAKLPVRVTGQGSMLSLHYGHKDPQRAADVGEDSVRLRRLIQLRCVELGVRVTGRGDFYLSLPITKHELGQLALNLVAAAKFALSGTAD